MKTPMGPKKSRTRQAVVHIKHASEEATLSPARKKFNRLVKAITTKKALLKEWQEAIRQGMLLDATALRPLIYEVFDYRLAFVRLVDGHYASKKLTKREKGQIKDYIIDVVSYLVDNFPEKAVQEELKALYEKYSDSNFEEDSRLADEETGRLFEVMLSEKFGFDFTEDNRIKSVEDFKQFLDDHREQIQDSFFKSAEEKPARGKKAEKSADTAVSASKVVQEVYRKLVGALHPDREPDEAERQRKTEVIQRVNVAYEKRDLRSLLELQLEIEQIDQSPINALAEDRLKHFNHVFQEQLDEIQSEIYYMAEQAKFHLPPMIRVTSFLFFACHLSCRHPCGNSADAE